MNLQSEQPCDTESREEIVAAFIRDNPDYFTHYPELLRQLELPHNSGDAVSLIERQVKALREETAGYKQKLDKLIAVALENEKLNKRLHHLTLTLIEAATFDEVINALEDEFHDDFQAEAMELHLFSSVEADRETNPDLDGFGKFLDAAIPQCGHLSHAKLEYLFGPQAEQILSTALIPIKAQGLLGLLAFGSYRDHRFHPEMGTEYLTRLGEIVSKTLEVVSEPGL
ncbi:MAG: DUF484 family protein [Gammaproteobacteria bacterium]|nr:DUF484 family protein [Gammaproteobacteria bacterium]